MAGPDAAAWLSVGSYRIARHHSAYVDHGESAMIRAVQDAENLVGDNCLTGCPRIIPIQRVKAAQKVSCESSRTRKVTFAPNFVKQPSKIINRSIRWSQIHEPCIDLTNSLADLVCSFRR